MTTLLICPSIRPAVPHLAALGSLATAPVFGDCLLGHWIEHMAARGAREIRVITADSSERVREAVGEGERWGVRVSITAASTEPTRAEAVERFRLAGDSGWLPAPDDVVLMSHLPGCPGLPLFESYSSWFAALIGWMPRARTPSRVRVNEIRPGIWAGSRSRVSPTAALIAPCWIGDQVSVEAGAVIGPGAVIEDRSVIRAKATVTQSWVGPDTIVGSLTSVANSLAWGSTLTDWRTDSSLRVPDRFLLGSLAKPQSAPATDRFGRALAAKEPSRSPPNVIAALRSGMSGASDIKLPS